MSTWRFERGRKGKEEKEMEVMVAEEEEKAGEGEMAAIRRRGWEESMVRSWGAGFI